MRTVVYRKVVTYVNLEFNTKRILTTLQEDFPAFTFSYKKVARIVRDVKNKIQGVVITRKPAHIKFSAAELTSVKNTINEEQRKDSSTTSTRIRSRLLAKYGLSISSSYINRIRLSMDFRATTAKYCHLVRDVNKFKRERFAIFLLFYAKILQFRFCREAIANREHFNDIVFSDESTFQVGNNRRIVYIRKGDYRRRLISRAKHPAKVICCEKSNNFFVLDPLLGGHF